MTTNRIAMWTLVAGLAAGAAYGQSDPYGPPGSQGQPGQYGQQEQGNWQGQYEDDWNESEDWYERQSRDDYDRNDRNDRNYPNDPNGAYGGYDDRGRAPGVDVGFFYGELSPYGEWVRHPYYGWVWFPRHVRAGWRPYSVGRWVESDYGWTWVSYEPFGWATYHYGRWAWDRYVGWLWVPGTDWGPAWVAWQQGNGYIGWAPLPPAVGFDLRVGIQLGGFNLSFGIAPRNYAFVDERRFLDTRIGGYIVPEARNVTIIHNTTNITNYTVVDNRVINHGVPVERVERVTGRRAQRLRVAAQTSSRATSVERDVVRIYRPAETKLESVKVAKRNNAGLRREAAKEPKSKAQAPANRPPATSQPRKQDAKVPIAVAPRAQPTPKKVNEREFVREQKELQSNQQKKQRELEQLQRQENAQSPAKGKAQPAAKSDEKGAQGTPKASAQDIQKRHAAELQEQKVLRERTAEQLKTRQQIQRQAAQASAEKAKAPAKAQTEQPKQGEKAKQEKAKQDKAKDQQEKNKKNQNEDQKPPRSI